MQVDLKGRLENVSLAQSNALMPLFEAIVNSIQAIEDAKLGSNGKIKISIQRSSNGQSEMDMGDRYSGEIDSFIIEDNGIGFDDNNFKSFDTSDSTHKILRGGKGIGRLFWLKAFDKAEITSAYQENEKLKGRTFTFDLNGVSKPKDTPELKSKGSKIKLVGFKDYYKKVCPKQAGTIANRIIEHCLIYFLDMKCPSISIHDSNDDAPINLNEVFKENIGSEKINDSFTIEGHTFKVVTLPLYGAVETNSSQLHWCSSKRQVESEALYKLIPDVKGKLKDSEGKNFVFISYLTSDYLDSNVNSERTAFTIPDKDLPLEEAGNLESASKKKIRQKISEVLSKSLKEKLDPVANEKREHIKKYVNESAPQYKPLLEYSPETLDKIAPGLSEDKIDLALHKAQYTIEKAIKEEGKDFVKKVVENPSLSKEEKEKSEKEFFKKVSAINQANLAKYVFSRKTILSLYDSFVKKKEDGTFDRESVIHNLIFPRYKTSNEVDYDNHNLWIIDERLAYHSYLGSDKEIQHLEGLKSENRDRPDLVVFDNSRAFSESEAPYSSVVVVEFKKPGRKDSGKEKDPVQQMFDYVDEIRQGKRRANDGSQLLVPDSIPFFLYLICDLTPEIHKVANGKDLTKSSDGLGYFGYNSHYSSYIEIVSYKKIGLDAWKRNRVFFDKLGLS